MIENRPFLNFLAHLVLIFGVVVVALPVWVALVASTHGSSDFLRGTVPMWFGVQGYENYSRMLSSGISTSGMPPVGWMMFNSLIMALGIALGKIAISVTSAFAIVYFRFPFRMAAFWIIFSTMMLPVEVRIVPTFKVVADLGMLNSYPGLIIPLIASATATFLFRQVFLSMPDELTEAARIDGAGPIKRFFTITLPLLSPTTFFLMVVNLVYAMFETFAVIDSTTFGGPAQSTNILVYKVYQDGFVGQNLGSSAAQSVILMAIVIALTVVQFRFIERRVQYQ